MLAPVDRPLHMLGLGMSVGTPPGGITAEVVAVSDFDELAKLGRDKVQGKIVLYNEAYRGYGATVTYRPAGPRGRRRWGRWRRWCARSRRWPCRFRTPATLRYDDGQPKIPAAAVSPEDAMMMARLCADGVPVKVHLEMARAHGAGRR